MLEEDLTTGEKWFLWRNRLRLDVHRAADRLEVPVSTYRDWEADRVEGPEIRIGGMDPHEHYLVLRKRAGLGQKRMARILGIGRGYFRRMEKGLEPLAKLQEYWGQ